MKRTMDTTLTFEQATRIVGMGLNLDLFDREQVISWADRLIAESDSPPVWLLELSTSRNLSYYDAANLLLRNVPPVSPELGAGVLLAIMSPLDEVSDDALQSVGSFLYRIVREVCDCDWTHRILCDIDQISDSFALFHQGYLPNESNATLRQSMLDFVAQYALPLAAESLSPIKIQLNF